MSCYKGLSNQIGEKKKQKAWNRLHNMYPQSDWTEGFGRKQKVQIRSLKGWLTGGRHFSSIAAYNCHWVCRLLPQILNIISSHPDFNRPFLPLPPQSKPCWESVTGGCPPPRIICQSHPCFLAWAVWLFLPALFLVFWSFFLLWSCSKLWNWISSF